MTRITQHQAVETVKYMLRQRKLHLIWRAIARRWRDAGMREVVVNYHNGDDESD